jgi:hypothetical protein
MLKEDVGSSPNEKLQRIFLINSVLIFAFFYFLTFIMGDGLLTIHELIAQEAASFISQSSLFCYSSLGLLGMSLLISVIAAFMSQLPKEYIHDEKAAKTISIIFGILLISSVWNFVLGGGFTIMEETTLSPDTLALGHTVSAVVFIAMFLISQKTSFFKKRSTKKMLLAFFVSMLLIVSSIGCLVL